MTANPVSAAESKSGAASNAANNPKSKCLT
jgi:hypothetical protein